MPRRKVTFQDDEMEVPTRQVGRGGHLIKQPVLGAPTVADPSSVNLQQGGYYMYYRRLTDGWITLQDADPNQVRDNVARGLQPLTKYGIVFLHPPKVPGANLVSGWREPYRVILDQEGGAEEFPVEQLVEMGWHRKPPYPEIDFPQLWGYKIQNHRCSFCQNRVFDEGWLLDKHIIIMHKDQAALIQQRELLSQLVNKESGSQDETLKELLRQLITVMAKQPATENTG